MKRTDQPSPYYPIFLNISGKRCVVVGGGQVAARKVRTLLEHGANVEVISPEICSELDKLAENAEIGIFHRSYRPEDLEGAAIAIAATSDKSTNLEMVREAKRKAIPVNVVDDPGISDFIVPSCVRRGEITIAISTAGKSPALARKLRTRLEKDLGNEYASLVHLIDKVRSEVKRQGIKVNGNTWQEALDLDLMIDLLKRGEDEKVKAVLLDNLKIQQE